MTRLHSFVLLFALLAQAWPLQAIRRVDEPAACGMSCCAALAAAEISECGCSEAPKPSEPANVPPAGGRDRVPQVVWMTSEDVGFATRPAMNLDESLAHFVESDSPKPPQVRLAVLFCSFLN